MRRQNWGLEAVGGEVLSRGQVLLRTLFTAGPGVLWITLFLVLPALMVLSNSFLTTTAVGDGKAPLTLENFRRLAGWDVFGFDPAYVFVLFRSLIVAAITTLLCVLLAYPIAFYIAAHGPRTRNLLLTLIVVPSWTNLVIRTYAFMILFAPDAPMLHLLQWLGLMPSGVGLYPSMFAVYVGMVNAFLPFVVLPLYTAIERLDWSLYEAARDLYASKYWAFWRVVFPQTLSGLMAGIILTLIPAFGSFIIPDLLGGAKTALVGNVIAAQFGSSRNWPFGATVCFLVMTLSLLALYIYARRVGEKGMRDLL